MSDNNNCNNEEENNTIGKKYFFSKFESDIQCVFDEICKKEGLQAINVKTSLKKGSIFLKGDFFLPLQSYHASRYLNFKNTLFNKLKSILYIKDCEYSSNGNLIFFINRPLVYRTVIQQVVTHSEKYGLIESNKSALILVSDIEMKDFDRLRIELIVNLIVSFLVHNNVKTHSNKYNMFTKSKVSSDLKKDILCSQSCSKCEMHQELELRVKNSEWRKKCCNGKECLCLDGRKYVQDYNLVEKYGKGINTVSLESKKGSNILGQTAFLKHVIDIHLSDNPDYVVHVVNHQQKFFSREYGLLYELLEISSLNQLYLDVQSTQVKSNDEKHVEDFIASRKEEIADAMVHKYETSITHDEKWVSRIEALLDSSIKFEILKINPNMPLKLEIPSNNPEKNHGIFVQYNYARLSNLFRNFESKVEEKYYEPLPNLDEIDFRLLKLEEEWNLLNYVIHFPKLVQGIFDCFFCSLTAKSVFPVNRICLMLSDLCHHLSLYYSRVRILGGKQEHFQNVMHARLWLLKGVYQVITNSFILLDIKGLDVM